jgi:multiple sugar transport system substrate-binding protein
MGSGVLEFDQTGKQTRTIGSASTTADMAINEKGQLLVYSSGQGMGGGGGTPSLKTYDTASGQQVSSIDVTGIGNMQSFFYDKAGKRVLYMTADDIRQLSADGKTNTVLLSFTDFALLTGDRQMMSFAVDGQGTIYLADYNSDAATASTGTASASSGQSALMGGGAMAYVFGGTNSANETMRFGLVDASTIPPVKTITLAALNDTRTLDRVISLFEVANPGDRIVPKYYNTTVQGYGRITGGTGNGQFDVSSLVQALNTDLMSGQGADLIVLDDLPWYKYVDKGLLLDLGQLMTQKNFDTTQYFTNILDACKVGGKLYGVPTSFSYSILTGKTADLPSSGSQQIADFLTKAKALPQGENAFQNEDATRLFESFMSNSYPDLVDTATHKANFDSPEFIQAMNDFKTLLSTNASTTQQQSDRGGFGPGGMMGAQAGQVNGTVAYDIESVTNPMVIMELRGISDSNNLGMSYMDIPTLSGSASGTFTTSMMFGINASTKNQDAAWLFIQTMLGSDIQGLGSAVLGGYPVLKSASDAAVDTYTKASTLGTNGQIEFRMGANSPSIVIKPLTSTDAQAIKTTLSSLNKLQSIDPNILQVLNEELPTFFSGQKTADEVAGLIQNRVNTIINE